MVDHSQNEDVAPPKHIENARGKALEIGATDGVVDNGEARGVNADLVQHMVQLIPE
jgi:hypothetical protein